MNKEVGGKKSIADINTMAAKEAHSCKNLIWDCILEQALHRHLAKHNISSDVHS
jgi:hypothetical protein